MSSVPRVLAIGGSDSGAGAGIQADLKTIAAFGAYGTTAVTAVTAQNTLGVVGVCPVRPDFVALQIQVILEDIGTDAVKTGMMVDAATIEAVVKALGKVAAPLVVDPVMVATGGQDLLDGAAVTALRELLIPRAAVLTPNLPEASRLVGFAVEDLEGMRRAAAELCKLGARAVLVKGGHLAGIHIYDVLHADGVEEIFEAPRIEGPSGHGTGCTLGSAIAVGLARGEALTDAIQTARAFVRAGLCGMAVGGGLQPLDHAAPGVWRRG